MGLTLFLLVFSAPAPVNSAGSGWLVQAGVGVSSTRMPGEHMPIVLVAADLAIGRAASPSTVILVQAATVGLRAPDSYGGKSYVFWNLGPGFRVQLDDETSCGFAAGLSLFTLAPATNRVRDIDRGVFISGRLTRLVQQWRHWSLDTVLEFTRVEYRDTAARSWALMLQARIGP